jgi:putative Mg2+ transporter-C (MgtC) family protein
MVASPWCEVVSVLIAFICGAIVGFERERGHKAAGLRTQILICVGSAVFTVISRSPAMGGREPARIAAQIVTGVGFLGAGSILRDRYQISGLTTAATIWTVSAIGIVAGVGFVTAAFLLSIGVLIVLGSFRKIEALLAGRCSSVVLRVAYRPNKGKARATILGVLDQSHGPIRVADETERPEGIAEMLVHHCDRHREHRAFVCVLAGLPEVEGLESVPPAA